MPAEEENIPTEPHEESIEVPEWQLFPVPPEIIELLGEDNHKKLQEQILKLANIIDDFPKDHIDIQAWSRDFAYAYVRGPAEYITMFDRAKKIIETYEMLKNPNKYHSETYVPYDYEQRALVLINEIISMFPKPADKYEPDTYDSE